MYIYTIKNTQIIKTATAVYEIKFFFRKQSKVRKYINIVLKEKLTI